MNSYFSHDSNARNDSKMLKLRYKHGAEGYGVYFMLLERLRDEKDYTSDTDYGALAYELRVDEELIRSVVEDFELFQLSDDKTKFYSKSLNERMEIKDEKSKKLSEAGKRGAAAKWGNRNNPSSGGEAKPKKQDSEDTATLDEKDSHPISEDIATPIVSDGNKSKVNKSKVNKSKDNNKEEEPEKIDGDDVPKSESANTVYQKNIGPINSLISQDVDYAIEDFTEQGTSQIEANQIIIKAIKVASDKGVRNWNFVKAVLKNWLDSNAFTLEAIEARDKEFENRKKQQSGGYRQPKTVEQGSDWSTKATPKITADEDELKREAAAELKKARELYSNENTTNDSDSGVRSV